MAKSCWPLAKTAPGKGALEYQGPFSFSNNFTFDIKTRKIGVRKKLIMVLGLRGNFPLPRKLDTTGNLRGNGKLPRKPASDH